MANLADLITSSLLRLIPSRGLTKPNGKVFPTRIRDAELRFLNGVAVQSITIDTSEMATDIIDYVAVNDNGLTSTSTRTVLIEVDIAAASTAQ